MYPKYITLIWENINDYVVKYTEEPILSCEHYITDVHLRKLTQMLKFTVK